MTAPWRNKWPNELALAGNANEARALNDTLMPVHTAMFVESNPIPVKWAVAHLGLMVKVSACR